MEMYSPVRRNTRKQQYTSAFDKNCLLLRTPKKNFLVQSARVLLFFLCIVALGGTFFWICSKKIKEKGETKWGMKPTWSVYQPVTTNRQVKPAHNRLPFSFFVFISFLQTLCACKRSNCQNVAQYCVQPLILFLLLLLLLLMVVADVLLLLLISVQFQLICFHLFSYSCALFSYCFVFS